MGGHRLIGRSGFPPVVAQLRNCSRCCAEYLEYNPDGRTRVCLHCKAPKVISLRGRARRPIFGLPLTKRQGQIADLVAAGKLNKQIAERLHLAEGTVKVFMGDIFLKSGATNRTELAIWRITGKLPE